MGFTEQGLQEQRQDLYEDITKLVLYDTNDVALHEVNSEEFNVVDITANPISFSFMVSGADIGVGNSVASYKLYKSNEVTYSNNFLDVNTCVTVSDTFTFTIAIGN